MFPLFLKLATSGYEFELDMLLACKYTSRPILEQPIATVYLEGNKSSHFNPILDSMRIYFVLLRFTLAGLLSAAIDYAVFIAAKLVAEPLVFLANFAIQRDFIFIKAKNDLGVGVSQAAAKEAKRFF